MTDQLAPTGLTIEALTEQDTVDLVHRCLTGTPAPPTHGGTRWCLAELTDGRLTGVDTGHGWVLSCDDFPDDSPARLAADRSDWWRLQSLRIFNPHEELRIITTDPTIDPPPLLGWRYTDRVVSDPVVAPRDRYHLLVEGRAEEDRGELTLGPSAMTTRYRYRHGRRGGITTILPLPARRPVLADGVLTASWLTIREYFAADPSTGCLGVAGHRYVRFFTGPRPRRTP